jgi:hypothetical protein
LCGRPGCLRPTPGALADEDLDRLRAGWLVIPDFHVDGPRGFGIQPWRVENLPDLLRNRASQGLPTIIHAADPYGLGPEIGDLIDRHFTVVSTEDVV